MAQYIIIATKKNLLEGIWVFNNETMPDIGWTLPSKVRKSYNSKDADKMIEHLKSRPNNKDYTFHKIKL